MHKKKPSKKQRDTQTLITLLYAISCKTLSDRFRFGKVRLERFCEGMSEVLKGVETGKVGRSMSRVITLEEMFPDKTPDERNALFEAIWADTEGEEDDDV